MILLSNVTQFNQMIELWTFAFVACPNRVEPPKEQSYLKFVPYPEVGAENEEHDTGAIK